MIESANPVLARMLDRLFASMVNGPAMNCRPHASRQRIDFAQIARLKDVEPGPALLALIGPERAVKLTARVPAMAKSISLKRAADGEEEEEVSPEERAARQAWTEQQALLTKIRVIADDARTYEQDTGVHALNVGFPLLSLPPGTFGGRAGIASRRILAPIAFIPAAVTIKSGTKQVIELSSHGDGVDLVVPNMALLAWLEQQTGQPIAASFNDEKGEVPWREIVELVRAVAARVDVKVPELFGGDEMPEQLPLIATPRSDEDEKGPTIVGAAVLGLFPTSNQGLLRDTREMLAGGAPDGPIVSLIRHGVSLDATLAAAADADIAAAPPAAPMVSVATSRDFTQERLATMADPCQTRAVRLARECRGLVIHGPPGTGKSQTIANVIGDHLARGERVLFVCDKRTALDVVADRLNALGLGDLCATVHDPQRDQRNMYRSVREQLDNLAETHVKARVPAKLEKTDAELAQLHEELTGYYRDLMGERGGPGSFHHLVGQWLSETGEAGDAADWDALQKLDAADFERHKLRLKEVLERGQAIGFATNPWRPAAGMALTAFLANPMGTYRTRMDAMQREAETADATLDPFHPPFEPEADLTAEAHRRRMIAEQLRQLKDVPAAMAGHWVKQKPEAVRAARAEIAAIRTVPPVVSPAEPVGPASRAGLGGGDAPSAVRLAAPTHSAGETTGGTVARHSDAESLLAKESRHRNDELRQDWVTLVKAGPLDTALRKSLPALPSAAELAADRATLITYAAAFDALAARYARLRAAAPDADDAVAMKWIAADRKAAAAARKRLDGAAAIADAIAAAPLDVSLRSRFESAPLESARMFEWLAALNAYLDIAGKWYAFLQFAKKKAALPAVQHFGLSLNAASAEQVKQLLIGVQKRMDLRVAVEAAIGEPFSEPRPDDADLLAAFRYHRAVLTALAAESAEAAATPAGGGAVAVPPAAGASGASTTATNTSPQPVDAPQLDEKATAAVNALVATQAEPAKVILDRFAVKVTGPEARRLAAFLHGLEARVRVAELLARLTLQTNLTADTQETELLRLLDLSDRLLLLLEKTPPGTSVGDAVATALVDSSPSPGTPGEGWGGGDSDSGGVVDLRNRKREESASSPSSGVPGEGNIHSTRESIIAALHNSAARAAAILHMDRTLAGAGLFASGFLKSTDRAMRGNQPAVPTIAALISRLDTLEAVIRINEGVSALPAELSKAASALLGAATDASAGFSAIRRNVLAGEIVRRLKACPNLQAVDGRRLQTTFDRFRELSEKKKEIVRDLIQHHWVSKQKERLLAGTGTRLNAAGADLRRRLTTRGERAMRLRQVIAHGASAEDGDPLFDLRPVWMASPETVAQLFPREPIFDVVVFDEASQCRLEEALPVLTRAKRVVIAGDQKQLPPTRFFESAVTTSEEEEPDTEQGLFELHQGEVEDLLTAALGLDIDQCYLDVHYRSRNSDLIGFSNEHFYGSRLQAIPGHPRNRTRYAPITLYRATGVYEKRRNEAEADIVCRIVRDLLKRATPPSIGIACFNLVQRDLIVEKLEGIAEEDGDFADRLAEARERRGPNSSEGLFVKNLENVQGDERDHIIISTTYGPDAAGKFRRNFGPLGTSGGGRRLNVLVTRARDELHLVTSIPRGAYTALPEVPPGTQPSGAWLLFAYLTYAEQLQSEYETNHRILEQTGPAERASVNALPSRTPSQFATALAAKLAKEHNHGSDVHWGNEGFCVDIAVQHPTKAEDVTIGVRCDMTRFAGSEDPVEWDVFSAGVHESQGWKLHRVWSPHFFRDQAGTMREIVREAEKATEE